MTLPSFDIANPPLHPIATIPGAWVGSIGQFELCVHAHMPEGQRNWLGGVMVVVSVEEYENLRRKHGNG